MESRLVILSTFCIRLNHRIDEIWNVTLTWNDIQGILWVESLKDNWHQLE